ncbi:hypothetical protein LTS18_004791 [Coniosporium uncinatum]|uniref:Uncharacterized protein n=1 Tax=Coniosporium uncinatum TaxID=93489 RepID=A0ACC3DRT4_9PEZI|nr:hypothetical protein LTS18_004791 [Coniosporium uncinatum]
MPPKDKYTDPDLRDQVKREIHEGDKGGAPGQWSARKAQMMASEYKKRGGGYTTDKKDQDASQKHLDKWTEEEWQTKEGSGEAKGEDGVRKRYLPKKAWEELSEGEKEETEERKVEAGREGRQFVGNTERARGARKKANEEEEKVFEERRAKERGEDYNDDDDDEDEVGEVEAEVGDEEVEDEAEDDEEGYDDEGHKDDEEAEDENKADVDDKKKGEPNRGTKRTRGAQSGTSKKQKSNSGKAKPNGTVGSKHDPAEPPAQQGSVDRLPEKGQQVYWKALPGFVDGEVVEVLTKEKEVEGKNIKASEKDPRIVLKSNSSGKICVHKPDACYFG